MTKYAKFLDLFTRLNRIRFKFDAIFDDIRDVTGTHKVRNIDIIADNGYTYTILAMTNFKDVNLIHFAKSKTKSGKAYEFANILQQYPTLPECTIRLNTIHDVPAWSEYRTRHVFDTINVTCGKSKLYVSGNTLKQGLYEFKNGKLRDEFMYPTDTISISKIALICSAIQGDDGDTLFNGLNQYVIDVEATYDKTLVIHKAFMDLNNLYKLDMVG
ncbi:hypothetical protein HNP86_001824 [Methanococcus maripaludis]|uniref:Uncharacterized protein n=1 Tax=Methanococcus maripaludis TaxID=39152 RepID=A0A7J9NWN8_METMI|nr:hypothetical protein [Methanococcus maripaludis]MBA2851665.1 hypothetical protein [Methanococcus maripaludis]